MELLEDDLFQSAKIIQTRTEVQFIKRKQTNKKNKHTARGTVEWFKTKNLILLD